MKKLVAYIKLARIHQYIKNGFLWLPLVFAEQPDLAATVSTAIGFVAFCLTASSVYILNDLRDVEEDRLHPVKQSRPLACGEISPREAMVFMALCLAASFSLATVFLERSFSMVMVLYVFLNIVYSAGLKNRAIVDVICIALGFVLRIVAGGITAQTEISHWIVIMTFLLAIFLALAKRRDDFVVGGDISNHAQLRKSLSGYNLAFISLSMGVMASVIIVSYILYTVSPEVVVKHRTDQLYLTGFWVVIGILRYLQITLVKQQSGSPTRVVLKDRPLQFLILAWLVTVYLTIHVWPSL